MSGSVDSRSDAALLRAYAAGDCHAFEELYRRHRHQLRRIARRCTRSVEDADDAVQEALLAVHRFAGSFRHDSTVASWLYRIVVNACLSQGREKVWPASEVLREDTAAPDRRDGVDTALTVRQALARLPAPQRAAVLAVDMYGLSVAEAARLLDIAEGTVKSRRARARMRLASLLRSA